MKNYLSQKDRDEILSTLSTEQKDFLLNNVRRGKRTEFANVIAKDKGKLISNGMTLEEVEDLLDDWILINYIDAGPNYRNLNEPLKCECGIVLRYQYVIKHKEINEIRKFGIKHFEEHTGIPAEIIRQIVKGFERIDYELDELLLKIKSGWEFHIDIPNGFEVPMEFKEHFDLDIPLLERQSERLCSKIWEYLAIMQLREEFSRKKHQQNNSNFSSDIYINSIDNRGSFTSTIKNIRPSFSFELTSQHVKDINDLLNQGIESAFEISKLLVEKYEIDHPSGLHKVCGYVVLYLNGLVEKGTCSLIRKDLNDSLYRLRNKSVEKVDMKKTDTCCVCGRKVSEKVRDFCLNNIKRFNGQVYCYDHQKNMS